MAGEFPSSRGDRLEWSALPAHIQAAVAEQLGAPVVAAVTQPEGFSPAVAARVCAANGVRAFVKGVPPDRNPDTPGIYRREIAVMQALPDGLPLPRLRWSLDEGVDGWVVLMLEEVDGAHPSLPWTSGDLHSVLAILGMIADTPAPGWIAGEAAGDWLAQRWCWWATVAGDPPAGLDDWSRRHAERFAEVDRDVARAVAGEALVHLDVRWDNLLVDGTRSWLVDWPWAKRGAWWLDALLFAPTVEMQGGPSADDVFARHAARRRDVDGDAVIVALTTATGMLTARSLAPPPPGLPALRPFQAAAARAYRTWLQRLTGLR